MKKLIPTSIGILILSINIVTSDIAQCSNNILPYSTFDQFENNIPTGWSFNSWNPVLSKERIFKSSPGYDGIGSCVELEFGDAIVSSSLTSVPIGIKTNTYYVFKGYYASTFGNLHKIKISGIWKNKIGDKIGTFMLRLPPTQDKWLPFFKEIKTPAESATITIKIDMKWDDGRVRFDEFSLREGRLRDYASGFSPVVKKGAFFPIYAWIPPGDYKFYNAAKYPRKSKYFASDEMQAQYAAANFTVGTKAIFGMKRKFSWSQVNNKNFDALMHPEQIWGFMGGDEPRSDIFPKLAEDKAAVLKFAAEHKLPDSGTFIAGKAVFNNLLPLYAFKKKPYEEYSEYLNQYIKQVKPTFLTYDYYPLIGSGTKYAENWFTNLEIVRKTTQAAKLDFGVFCASAAFCGIRSPNESEMRWEAFSTLCYGSRFLGWFTFLRQINGEGLRDTIIDEYGDRTAHYSMVRQINAEVLTWAPVLLSIKSTAVYHTSPLPMKTMDIANSELLSVKTDGQLILGEFEDENDTSTKYFMLVNKDYINNGQYELTFKSNIKKLYEISKIKEASVDVINYNVKTRKVALMLKPGDARLFKIGK